MILRSVSVFLSIFFLTNSLLFSPLIKAAGYDEIPEGGIPPVFYLRGFSGYGVAPAPGVSCVGPYSMATAECLTLSEQHTPTIYTFPVGLTRTSSIPSSNMNPSAGGFYNIDMGDYGVFYDGYVTFEVYKKSCPTGYELKIYGYYSGYYCKPITPIELDCKTNPGNGTNPILNRSGTKYQKEDDIVEHGQSTISVTRHYNSAERDSSGMGIGWSHSYSDNISTDINLFIAFHIAQTGYKEDDFRSEEIESIFNTRPSALNTTANIKLNDGTTFHFVNTYNPFTRTTETVKWRGPHGLKDSLETINDPVTGAYAGLKYVMSNGETRFFSATGRLDRIIKSDGQYLTLNYDDVTGRLNSVTNNSGKSLTFTYSGEFLSSISSSDGHSFSYMYDTNNNLTTVTKPDGTTRIYHYENSLFPNALTGITNEPGIRYATWTYDDRGRAISSEHAGGADRVTLEYIGDSITRVTKSNGQVLTYYYDTVYGTSQLNRIEGGPCASCGSQTQAKTYDTNGFVASRTDFSGVVTSYINDTQGRVISKTEASGTPEARTTTYTYDPRFYSKLATQTEPSVYAAGNKVTTYSYDDFGNTTSIQISGFTPAGVPVSRTTTMQYNGPLNQITQIDGPRVDVSDITSMSYYANDAVEGYNRARLKSVTGPTGVVQRNNIQYSATGKVISEERPNGLIITNTYYAGNDRLETSTQSAGGESRTTRWTYLPTGEVETITQAYGTVDARTITFSYDNARRMTRITDGLGNYIEYTLDTEGNKTAENHYDNLGILKKSLSQTFDIYNQLDIQTQANETSNNDYTVDGLLDKQTDGKGSVTDYNYDAFKRLTSTIQNQAGSNTGTADILSRYGYDVHHNLTSATDPNNNTTTYVYDDLGNLLSQTSPDTGTTTFTYDEAGNITTRTDAKGQTLSYGYDATNRLLTIDAEGIDDDVTNVYDNCTNGVGKLCKTTLGNTAIFDLYRVVNYRYTPFGEVTDHQFANYTYDTNGNIKTIRYPSGSIVTYFYDNAAQVSRVDLEYTDETFVRVTRTIVNNVSYLPFGPVKSYQLGNGVTITRERDTAYRLLNQAVDGSIEQNYGPYDGNGNLTGLSFLNSANGPQSFDYDELNRLISANDSVFNQSFDYDRNDNRTDLSDSGASSSYSYQSNSNRLNQAGVQIYQLDANGNTVDDGAHSYSYNAHNRLVNVDTGAAHYTYNALGQRVTKHYSSGYSIPYVYDLQGKLLGEYEYSITSAVSAEYIYLGKIPIAMTSHGKLYYINTDHLNTPREVIDAGNNTIVWRWDADAFGATAANEDPDGDGRAFEFNLRFPGQYYDKETGLHYNYFRYYDPKTGRYLTSDPIGLKGGLNTYGYVRNNPLTRVDPTGLVDSTWNVIYPPNFNTPESNCRTECNVKYQPICTGIGIATGVATTPVGGAAAAVTCVIVKAVVCSKVCDKDSCNK